MTDAGVRTDVAVAVERRARSPPSSRCRRCASAYPARERDRLRAAACSTPGLVDSHTHAIFGRAALRRAGDARRGARLHGDRAARRRHSLVGARSARARRGRAASTLARARLRRLASHGTTTVEVKSGYGLTLDDELKTLRVIDRLPTRAADAHRADVPRRARDPARASRLDADRAARMWTFSFTK